MPPARPFSCRICSRAFTRTENLDRHIRTHHDAANAPRFECHLCHARFARKDVCKRHSDNCEERQGQSSLELPSAPLGVVERREEVITATTPENGIINTVHLEEGLHMEEAELQPGADISLATSHISAEDMSSYLELYIAYFHASVPILHTPTLDLQTLPPPLSKAIAAIGCLFSARKGHVVEVGRSLQLSQDFWESGCSDVEKYVKEHRQRLRMTWVLQSWILFMVYATFTGNEKRVTKAQDMYRYMADAIREYELMHQKFVIPFGSAWDAGLGLSVAPDEVQRRWQRFVDQESIKLSLYAFYYLDYHLFSSFNMRPMISSIEFEWDLPAASSLWNAVSATEWWRIMLQLQLNIESSRGGYMVTDEELQTQSLMAATQCLLSNSASQQLLLTLSSSPFATLCVVANLEGLVRDFTRCYYQLPPTLADPSPFHVLTQVQNAQVSTALGIISSFLAKDSCEACDSSCTSLWHAVRLGCMAIRISLCQPDDLLVGGIIEGSPAAGLATSVHLSLGNHVASRRSGMKRSRKPIADDGFVSILDDMLHAMHEMGITTSQPSWEAPWTTVQGFKILIVLWKALRYSIADLQAQVSPAPTFEKHIKIYDPAKTVVNAIITALDIYDPSEQHILHNSLLTSAGLEDVDRLETQFIGWMKKLCDRRDIWTIGRAMGRLLDEIAP